MSINKVSIITPTYNSERFVTATINSILTQSYCDWELLITDDCSNDKTWDLLKKYSELDSRIKIFRLTQNSGAGVARNNSIKQATGRYIAFCDSDDQWKSNKLEKQLKFMLEKKCALTYSSYDVIDENNVSKGTVIAKASVDYSSMLKNNYIGCLTAIYDTHVVGKIYMPEIRKRQDWALWFKILKVSNKAYGMSETLAIYRDRSDSISTNKKDLIKYNWAIYKDVEGFSTVKSIYFMGQFILFYILKKIK